MNCRTRFNPPCVFTNFNHIRFETNARDWITFLYKPLLKLGAILLNVSLLFTEETHGFLYYVSLGRNLTFPFVFGSIIVLSLVFQEGTFSLLHQQSSLLLDTHGHQFIDGPFVFMRVVEDLERFVLLQESVQNVVHKERFEHIHLQLLQLGHNVSHIHDVLTHTLTLVSLNDENFMIKALANALSEVINCSSIAFSNALMLVCCSTEPRILAKILNFMYMTLRRLDRS